MKSGKSRITKMKRQVRADALRAEREAKAESGAANPIEVRTNIVMEEPLVMEAQAITGIKTKTGVVHYALREIVRRARQKEMLALRGKVAWDGDLDDMRKSRH